MANRRLYVPLSVGTHIDDRINDAGDAAELLWYRILQVVKTNESDGIIGHAQAVKLHSTKAVAALVRVGLLRPLEGAETRRYRCAGWHDWNLSAAQIAVRREADKARKAEQKGSDSGTVPAGKPPDSGRNPNGIRSSSAAIPAGLLAEAVAVAEGPDEVDPEGTSQVLPDQGSAPSRLRPDEAQPLNGSIAAALRGVS